MIQQILCKLGFHSWVYKHPKTGIYLHKFTYQRECDFEWEMKKCEFCGVRQTKKDETK